MKNREAKVAINKEIKTKQNTNSTNSKDKVLRAMAMGIAMALATTSVPMNAMAAEDTSSSATESESTDHSSTSSATTDSSSSSGTSNSTNTSDSGNLSASTSQSSNYGVSATAYTASETSNASAQEQLSTDAEAATEQVSQAQDTLDAAQPESAAEATDTLIGTVNPDIVTEITSQDSTGATTETPAVPEAGTPVDSDKVQNATPSVDDQIADLEQDYETVKSEFEEANHVKVEASQELQQAAENYDAAKDQLLQVQAGNTANEQQQQIENTLTENGIDVEKTLEEGQEIAIDTPEYLNMLTAYKQSLMDQSLTEEEANQQVLSYHQCVLDYNASLKNYQETQKEYQEANENASVAYDKLIDTVKKEDTTVDTTLEVPVSTETVSVEQTVGTELANTKTYGETVNATQTVITTIADQLTGTTATPLSEAVSKYFAKHSQKTDSLDSQGITWANGLGEGNTLSETINETMAVALGYTKDQVNEFKSQYNWKITKNTDGSYNIYVSANNESSKQLTCSLTTSTKKDDAYIVATDWMTLIERKADGTTFYALDPTKKEAYAEDTADTKYTVDWSKFQEETQKYSNLNEADQTLLQENKELANAFADALQDTESKLYEVVNAYFTKFPKDELNQSGKTWANGEGSQYTSINTMLTTLLNKTLGTEYKTDYVKENYLWKIQNTGNGLKLYISPNNLKDANGNNIVYIIDGIGNAEKTNTAYIGTTTVSNSNLVKPGITVKYDNLALAENVTNVFTNYKETIATVITATSNAYSEAAKNLLNALNLLKGNVGNSDMSYEDAVQNTIDAAKDYIAELSKAGTEEDLVQNATGFNPGTDAATEGTNTAAGNGGAANNGTATTIAAVNDMITQLQNVLDETGTLTTIDDTQTPLAATASQSTEAQVQEADQSQATVQTDIAGERTNLTGANDQFADGISVSMALNNASNPTTGATTLIADENVALADTLPGSTHAKDLMQKTQSFMWWILAAIAALGTATYGRKYILLGKKKKEEK